MRRTQLALAATALLVAHAACALAAEHHVGPIGNDGAAGSLAAPYRTIRHALDVAGPGDTIYLHAGTYAEGVSSEEGAIRGGTSWANALVIAAFPGDMVVLEPSARFDRVLTFADARASYVVVRGLVLDARNVKHDGVKITWSAPDTSNSSHHIRIEDSEVVNAPGQGLLVGGHHNELLRLRVHGNGVSDFDHGFYITSADNLVDGCSVYQNAGWGVHVYNGEANDADRNVVRNNRIFDNARVGARGAGIGISNGEGNLAYNNVIFGNKIGIQVDYSAVASKLYNNTVFANAGYGIYLGDGAADSDVRNNLVFGNAPDYTDAGARTSAGANLIGGDPGIVDASRFDARLRASSPAIDRGETLDDVKFDHAGVPRPQGAAFDVGAYEYSRVPKPTSPPASE
jgi:parallel beta-helix repeat protein